jgi:hypothetical protein
MRYERRWAGEKRLPARGKKLTAIIIRMAMTPFPVIVLIPAVSTREVAILAMLLLQVPTISLVFPIVPPVPVLAGAIVVAVIAVTVMMLIIRGSYGHGYKQRCTE